MKKSQLKQLIREVINEIHGLPESEVLKNWAKKKNPDIDVVDFTEWAIKKYNFKTAEELDKKIKISYENIPHYDHNRMPNVHGNYERAADHDELLSRLYSGYEKDVNNKTWIPRAQR